MRLNATTEQLAKCWYNWQSGHHADAKGLRLGQYIWNTHGITKPWVVFDTETGKLEEVP
jgi:hypothetical protein